MRPLIYDVVKSSHYKHCQYDATQFQAPSFVWDYLKPGNGLFFGYGPGPRLDYRTIPQPQANPVSFSPDLSAFYVEYAPSNGVMSHGHSVYSMPSSMP